MFFWVLCFPNKGRIIIVDQLSLLHPDPSSGASTVLMIENPQLYTVNLGARLFPYLMGTFDYPIFSNDVKFILVILEQPKAAIFQVTSFRMSYFNKLWILPFPSALMEGIEHPGMAMLFSAIEVA